MAPPAYPQYVLAAFERFWKAYPHRPVNPRAPALAVFAKLVKAKEDPETLIAAAGSYAAVVKAEFIDPVSIPHARRWLNQRFFDDYTPDALASADDGQPAPEHPMDWARAHVTPETWISWFSRLSVQIDDDGAVAVVVPTAFGRDRLDTDWRPLFLRHYGRAFRWTIKGADA